MLLADITAQYNLNISEDTLIKELAQIGLNQQAEHKKPYLSLDQRDARLAFAQKYKN